VAYLQKMELFAIIRAAFEGDFKDSSSPYGIV
jgi:hypothetical protein